MGSYTILVYLFLYTFVTNCKSSVPYKSKYDYGINADTVAVEYVPGNSYELFPDRYLIWFEYEGKRVYYNLQKDDRTTQYLTPSIFKFASFIPDDLMTDDNIEEFAFYHNGKDTGASDRAGFILHRTSIDTDPQVYGKFVIDGDKYHIQHVLSNDHRVMRSTEDGNRGRRSVVPGTTNIIEVFVWSAPDVYRFHKTRLGIGARATEEFLRTWERAIIRDVDLIFKRISTTDLRLFYMGGSNDRSLTVDWYSDNVNGDIMRENALSDVRPILETLSQTDVLPNYDHVIVMTRQNLADNFGGSGADKIAFGLSNSLCMFPPGSSVSLAEVSSPFFVKAVAQSIIFSLGIGYTADRDATNTVMSRSVDTVVRLPDRAGRWTVDGTSQAEIRRNINALSFNCLLIENFETNFNDFIIMPSYGALYPTLREQCRIFVGASSRECQTPPLDAVCYNGVRCLDTQGDCTVDYFTGDRTPCGSGENSCRYGDCSLRFQTTTPFPTTPRPDACCCERRSLGRVSISMRYVPCRRS